MEDSAKKPRIRGKELHDIFLEFVEVVIHEVLYLRGAYPMRFFEERRSYQLVVHQCTSPMVREYVSSATSSILNARIRGKELHDIFLEFVEVVIHEVLYLRGAYPMRFFEERRSYQLVVHQCTSPMVREYVSSATSSILSALREGVVGDIGVRVSGWEDSEMVVRVLRIPSRPDAPLGEEAFGLQQVEDQFRKALFFMQNGLPKRILRDVLDERDRSVPAFSLFLNSKWSLDPSALGTLWVALPEEFQEKESTTGRKRMRNEVCLASVDTDPLAIDLCLSTSTRHKRDSMDVIGSQSDVSF
eukprot:TRINITY_DN8_c0_g1_i1.p1 TRINITY_DN8_c0_g1~~TRINITY_DN8_c0_g1_i1.p1  ORF type:complete len:309 (-),score=71.66 TRINITY_DN8_c0_g1_i1:589-1491(-)